MTSRIEAKIGRVHGDRYLPVSKALEGFVGHPLEVENLQGWAGPNDFMQIIMDWASWYTLAKLGVGVFGTGMLAKFGQLAAEGSHGALKRLLTKAPPPTSEESNPDQAKFDALTRAITGAIDDGYAVTFSIPTQGQFRNHMGVQLTTGDPVELISVAASLGEIGNDLCQVLESQQQSGKTLYGEGHNRDGGPKIEQQNDGSVIIRLSVSKDGQSGPLVIHFDKDGKLDRVETSV
ncbi:hypothetical protein [Bradyrhizobium sp. CCGE-LA001]|uniref:hypothetical protein n=1 Tax=Bradyrhizobium sp. CCGE-LA001 TaxID=1223566 RepID=UPI0002AA7912|nr:hypothetical protein [Bradyrhizobium sp. CCGE-LA001]